MSLSEQGYLIGNPSTDGSTTYNLNGVYQGFNLITPALNQQLNSNECQNSLTNFNESVESGNSSAGLSGALPFAALRV